MLKFETILAKEVRSWSKPDNVSGLIGIKKVDWSIFEYGTHIPLEFVEDFEWANGNIHIGRGERYQVELITDDRAFEAFLDG